jgi:PIN domain nuclease of toxin-antitoxin system
MATENITLDAHTLVWYMDGGLNYRLSNKALQAVKNAEVNATVYVPAIALMEIAFLVEKGKINSSFDTFMSYIEENKSYQIVPIDSELLKVAIPLVGLDIHDRLILATAVVTNTSLVCNDNAIKIKSKSVNVSIVW